MCPPTGGACESWASGHHAKFLRVLNPCRARQNQPHKTVLPQLLPTRIHEEPEKKNVILPVWLNADAKDVFNYSPRLADKVGIMAKLGIPEVARQLANAIKSAT